jgi:hypothetical protein
MLSVLSFLLKHWALVSGAVVALAALAAIAAALGPAALLKRWKWIVAAAVAAAAFVVGAYLGASRVSAQWAAEKAKTAAAVAKVETKQTDVSANVEANTIKAKAAVTQKAAVIIKRVPVYVTAKNDAACSINGGFVRVWNAANSGLSLPDAPGVADGQTSGVVLSDVASEHARESEYARSLEVTVEGWQEWAAKQEATTK